MAPAKAKRRKKPARAAQNAPLAMQSTAAEQLAASVPPADETGSTNGAAAKVKKKTPRTGAAGEVAQIEGDDKRSIIPPLRWIIIRHAYAVQGLSAALLARRFGMKANTIHWQCKREGWDEPGFATTLPSHLEILYMRHLDMLERQIAAIERKVAETETAIQNSKELSPELTSQWARDAVTLNKELAKARDALTKATAEARAEKRKAGARDELKRRLAEIALPGKPRGRT